ncbi:MAG: GNAT family N-acetyltransferase, partial [Gemmatimonadetes bacterium]|nr:GNAT family N-acetyltransferase [Gemmatimonadota bacterium]NIR80807.1 GNAT family N-acetyltransferase [Gemmatimonadota bacterium]NIT89627.1 GNAT family N-acetyltransferase [Gemmatimonadota bacterium]NIU33404.1 GNAT family N-acetyltransferase [Gemmatimonadota bacterium]NIU37699.1 GNAT family N-acetyltransferase [Gemmatimonadota bacterium]
LRPLFRPRSVAVAGASRDPESVGHRILVGLLHAGFQGTAYPVNPEAGQVASVRAWPSVSAIEEPVDLAVVAVPAHVVPAVVDDCADAGVEGLVVISAGFAEVGPEGQERQRRLLEQVRAHGMRMVGPNCLGLLHTDPEVRLNASFAPRMPPHGRIALCSQSGALGIAIIALARRLELGLSAFVSVGNKADVAADDLLEYWEEDPGSEILLFYLESFSRPRRFGRIARRVGRSKPIVVVKSGRSEAGGRAAGSHTAALSASDVAVDALFRQTGVLRAETLEEMFGIARALADQPLPRGRRFAVVTNSGGPAILCTDALEAAGIEVEGLSEETRSALEGFLPPAATTGNPVDMIASAGPEEYRRAVKTVLLDGDVDGLVVVYTPVGIFDTAKIGDAVADGVRAAREAGGAGKPVYASIVGGEEQRYTLRHAVDDAPERTGGALRIPVYPFPEEIGRVAGSAARYAEWRASEPGAFPEFENQRLDEARATCRSALEERGSGWLSVAEARRVLELAGLRVPEGGVGTSPDHAVEIARRVGFPVAVKLASIEISHKTDIGAVKLGLEDPDGVRAAYAEIEEILEMRGQEGAMEGVLVQPMLEGAAEVMAGMSQDPVFGPVLAFGLGGIHVEVLRDVAFRVAPLTDRDAREMVREIRGYRLLEGYRGHPPADVAALEEGLLRLSLLVDAVEEIRELDLNPIFALEPGEGYRIADVRIRVRPT